MQQIKVLDHGYIKLIETYGKGEAGQSEAGIVEAARQSTQGNFKGWGFLKCRSCGCSWRDNKDGTVSLCSFMERSCPICEDNTDEACDFVPGDEKLLHYLHTHRHATPFEFAGMVIEVQAPIFVFREWHRHRTQSYNEMSARYAPMPNTHYIPTLERLMMKPDANKQAGAQKDSEPLDELAALTFQNILRTFQKSEQDLYTWGLDKGIPKELARLPVSVARYSRMRASANLRNWLAFLTLRMDPAAQWEIRQYANAVGQVIAEQFPQTWALFEAGRK